MRRAGIFSIAASLALVFDLWTKHLIVVNFQLYESLPLLPGLALTYVRNPGAAFSLLADADPTWRLPFFMLVLVVALVACIYMLRQTPIQDRVSRLGLGLIVGGALGNGLDRIRYGEVVDFVEVGVRSVYTWPIFNVADSAVFIGVALLIWRAFKPLPTQE